MHDSRGDHGSEVILLSRQWGSAMPNAVPGSWLACPGAAQRAAARAHRGGWGTPGAGPAPGAGWVTGDWERESVTASLTKRKANSRVRGPRSARARAC